MDVCELVAIGAGGLAGAMVRWAVIELVPETELPWAVLMVNVTGSLLLGSLVVGFIAVHGPRSMVLLAVGVGFCGSLTTFSTVSVAVADQLRDGDPIEGLGYLIISLGLGVGAAWAGGWVTRRHLYAERRAE